MNLVVNTLSSKRLDAKRHYVISAKALQRHDQLAKYHSVPLMSLGIKSSAFLRVFMTRFTTRFPIRFTTRFMTRFTTRRAGTGLSVGWPLEWSIFRPSSSYDY